MSQCDQLTGTCSHVTEQQRNTATKLHRLTQLSCAAVLYIHKNIQSNNMYSGSGTQPAQHCSCCLSQPPSLVTLPKLSHTPNPSTATLHVCTQHTSATPPRLLLHMPASGYHSHSSLHGTCVHPTPPQHDRFVHTAHVCTQHGHACSCTCQPVNLIESEPAAGAGLPALQGSSSSRPHHCGK